MPAAPKPWDNAGSVPSRATPLGSSSAADGIAKPWQTNTTVVAGDSAGQVVPAASRPWNQGQAGQMQGSGYNSYNAGSQMTGYASPYQTTPSTSYGSSYGTGAYGNYGSGAYGSSPYSGGSMYGRPMGMGSGYGSSSMYGAGGGYPGSNMYGSSAYGSSAYGGGAYGSNLLAGGSMYGGGGGMYNNNSLYSGGGLPGQMVGGPGPAMGPDGRPLGPAEPPSKWQAFMHGVGGLLNFFGRISFLVDENTHALHFFISALLQLLDRASFLYGEIARFVLRLLGYKERPPAAPGNAPPTVPRGRTSAPLLAGLGDLEAAWSK